MSDNNVEVRVSADGSGVPPGMQQAEAAVKNGVAQIKAHLEGFVGGIEKVQKAFVALTAIVAGGAMFKEAIDETRKITGESIKLGKAFGITTTEASVMRVALASVGATAEDAQGAVGALTRTLRTAPENFTKLGVAVRDANGEFRPMADILIDVNDKFSHMADGTAKNLALAGIFGRQWQSIGPILKLTSEGMEDAKKRAEELGLVVGQENVEASIKYRTAMAEMKDVVEAMEKAIGDAVMPVLTQLGEWFAEIGPAAVLVIKGAIGGLVAVFYGLKMAVELIVETQKMGFKEVAAAAVMLLDIWRDLQTLNWAKAKADFAAGTAEMVKIAKEGGAKMLEQAEKNQAALGKLFNTPTPTGPKAGQAAPDFTKDKGDNGMLAAQFSLKKAMTEADLAQTKDALDRSSALYDQAYSRNLISTKDYYAARLEIEMVGLSKEADAKKQEIADAEALEAKAGARKTPEGDKEVLKFRTQIIKLTSDLEIIESKRAEAAINNNAKMLEAERKRADAIESIDISAREKMADNAIAASQNVANTQYELGLMSKAKLIDLEMQYENQKAEISANAIKERLKLEVGGPNDPVAVAQLNVQLEELENEHQLRMTEIRSKSTIEQKKYTTGMYSSMQSGFENVIKGTLNGTMKISGLFKNLFKSVISSITDMLAKMAAEWLASMIKTKIASIATATTQVEANAAVAGSAAAGSAAQDGPYGWMIALAAGAAVYAGAKAFTPSAKSGYDIPAGVNPMTQLHEKEMVLPASQANVIRDMAEGGTKSQSSSDTHVHIHATDAHSVKRLFENNGHALLSALRKQGRNFAV